MTTKTALKESIEHWLRNEQALDEKDVLTGTSSCSLCQMFFDRFCKGCPVFIATDKVACDGSPYNEAYWALEEWRAPPVEHEFIHNWTYREAFHLAAADERRFLEGLLDE